MGEIFGGRYELIDPIGQGGMGTVWRARDLKQQRVVAVKVLRQTDAYMLLRFVREQGLRIQHPNVVAPVGWLGEDDKVLFAMRLITGGSLSTVIGDHGPLPPRFAAEVLRQVLSGLSAVHEAKLVHRDIKPANILFDATGTAKPHCYVTDFGIAVDLNGPRFTETGLVTGTPGYLAPELKLLGEVTPAVDLYSVGTVGAVMLTARKPSEVSPNPPPGTPPALWRLLTALRNDDPSRRPTLEEAQHQLTHPDLTWNDDAIGEVDVLEQLGPLPGESRPSYPAVSASPAHQPAPQGGHPPAGAQSPPVGPPAVSHPSAQRPLPQGAPPHDPAAWAPTLHTGMPAAGPHLPRPNPPQGPMPTNPTLPVTKTSTPPTQVVPKRRVRWPLVIVSALALSVGVALLVIALLWNS